MDLRLFVENYSSSDAGTDLINSGPASQRVFDRLGNEGLTRSLIATIFWRAFLASEAFDRALKYLNASAAARTTARTIVVPRPELQRFDLVVLDPDMPYGMPPSSLDIDESFFGAPEISKGASVAARDGVPPAIGADNEAVALEAAFNSQMTFAVIIAPAPGSEPLSVPATPVPVDNYVGNMSTAGVVVECCRTPGVIGVTAALHGIGASTSLDVDGQTGTLNRSDTITDSAFLTLSALPSATRLATNGVMSGKAPSG